MAYADAIGTFPEEPNLPQPAIDTQRLDASVLERIVENLDDDDVWKLRVLLCPCVPPDAALDAGALFTAAKKAAAAQDEFARVVVELLFTIKRYDLLKLTGNCKHRLKRYFDANSKLDSRSKKFYDEAEASDAPVAEILERLKQIGPDVERPSVKRDDANVDSLPWYPMERSPCGVCVIINNETFDVLGPRNGSNMDELALKKTFEKLDFEVTVHRNLTTGQMRNVFQMLGNRSYEYYNCFVCCVLSHGLEGVVFGVDSTGKIDGKYVSIEDGIVRSFSGTKCKTLIGKPKLFFIQACQGDGPIPAVPSRPEMEKDGPASSKMAIPIVSDHLIGIATVKGYSAYRSTSQGTWYIKHLTDQLNKQGDRRDIFKILTKVNDLVIKEQLLDKKETLLIQMPIYSSTLTKQLKFRRKRHPEEA